MNDTETQLWQEMSSKEITIPSLNWENCRKWMNEHEWKINVLSDYPRGEVKLTVRKGFERFEIHGFSDLEVMAKAILEIHRRNSL